MYHKCADAGGPRKTRPPYPNIPQKSKYAHPNRFSFSSSLRRQFYTSQARLLKNLWYNGVQPITIRNGVPA